ncbi:transcription initiation factor IIA subunit 2 isoform X2 [Zootoca vivipara]|uniref:transcription initiation factor IIA subunit 2 isoform X2 n=1 Tax=Zootoca vivipara TaxID=8524 RepID=UPI00293C03D2|nr:transcription initiation factor IIA subunit 2 isoform X2 [Zootoca vivipara]
MRGTHRSPATRNLYGGARRRVCGRATSSFDFRSESFRFRTEQPEGTEGEESCAVSASVAVRGWRRRGLLLLLLLFQAWTPGALPKSKQHRYNTKSKTRVKGFW